MAKYNRAQIEAAVKSLAAMNRQQMLAFAEQNGLDVDEEEKDENKLRAEITYELSELEETEEEEEAWWRRWLVPVGCAVLVLLGMTTSVFWFSTIPRLETELATANETIAAKSDTLKDVRTDNAILQDELTSAEVNVKMANEKNETLAAINDSLAVTNSTLKSENETLQATQTTKRGGKQPAGAKTPAATTGRPNPWRKH